LATTCTVIRDEKQQKVEVEQLVPVISFTSMATKFLQMVFALCRGLKTENSSLTGESEPIACTDRVSAHGYRMFE
jgi:magnesium-transporting ATPase (P-type)